METKNVGSGLVSSNLVRQLKNQNKDRIESDENLNQNSPKAGYQVQLSDVALERKAAQNKARLIAQNTNPIREDKVMSLKKLIESGEYNIDSGKIADGILKEAIKERLSMEEDLG